MTASKVDGCDPAQGGNDPGGGANRTESFLAGPSMCFGLRVLHSVQKHLSSFENPYYFFV